MSVRAFTYAFAIVLLVGCYDGDHSESTVLSFEAAGSLDVVVENDGRIRLTASGGRTVETVDAATTTAAYPDGRTIDLSLQRINLKVDGLDCFVADAGVQSPMLHCEVREFTEMPATVGPPLESLSDQDVTQEPTESDLAQSIKILPGMHCGLHYEVNKWQIRFDVSIEASTLHLQQIESVEYDVFRDFVGNGDFKRTDPADGFNTRIGFLTPVSGWSTGPAKVTLKSGTVLSIPGALVSWINPEPDLKPTGLTCTP